MRFSVSSQLSVLFPKITQVFLAGVAVHSRKVHLLHCPAHGLPFPRTSPFLCGADRSSQGAHLVSLRAPLTGGHAALSFAQRKGLTSLCFGDFFPDPMPPASVTVYVTQCAGFGIGLSPGILKVGMVYVLTALHVVVCFFLIIVVLLQSGKAADLAGAFGGMGSQTVFGPRGTATVLSKATTIAAGVFMITSLTLAILSDRSAPSTGSVLENRKAPIVQKSAQPPPKTNTKK
jgi:preprotein translocase subunit SecG